MKFYGLTLSEISILISIISAILVFICKVCVWFFKQLVEKYTKPKFDNIEKRIEEFETKQVNKCEQKHCMLDDELENKYATKEDLERFSDNFALLAQNIREDFHEVTKRIDNFILKFINKKD